jgi:3-dehydrotetronate 4-kinase
MQLGAIADDVTGGTDLASVLRRAGLGVVQILNVPRVDPPPADGIVISLKTRTVPAAEAQAAAAAPAPLRVDGGATPGIIK